MKKYIIFSCAPTLAIYTPTSIILTVVDFERVTPVEEFQTEILKEYKFKQNRPDITGKKKKKK